MEFFRSRLSIACVTAAAALGVLAAPAAAWYCPPPAQKHCNAGRGNGSEGCDPGKSSTSANGSTGQNMGGDEGGPIQGGTGAP